MSTLALLLNFCLPAATVRISQSCTQIWFALLFICSLNCPAYSVFEPQVIAFGNKWNTVPWSPGGTDEKPLLPRVRPLLVEAYIKEFTIGPAHDVTDRLFVVRCALSG